MVIGKYHQAEKECACKLPEYGLTPLYFQDFIIDQLMENDGSQHTVTLVRNICDGSQHTVNLVRNICDGSQHTVTVVRQMCEGSQHTVILVRNICNRSLHAVTLVRLMCDLDHSTL